MRAERWLVPLGKAIAVVALLVWSLAPILFMLLSSVKPGQDIFAVPPRWLFTPTFEHYAALQAKWGGFFTGLANSAIVAVGATLLAVAASVLAGFAYSRHRGP